MIEADRSHLHHAFLRSGWSVNATVGVIVSVAVGLATIGLLLDLSMVAEHIQFYMFLGVSGIYYFGMSRVWNHMNLFGREIV